MNIVSPLGTVVVAGLAAGLALGSAFAFGGALQRQTSRDSHQQPMPEQFPEPDTPASLALVAQGRRLFLDSCAHCHGADGRGDEGPDLHAVQVSDRYIINT